MLSVLVRIIRRGVKRNEFLQVLWAQQRYWNFPKKGTVLEARAPPCRRRRRFAACLGNYGPKGDVALLPSSQLLLIPCIG